MKTGRRPRAWPVDTLADLLATAVSEQWWQAATERRLLTPEPIPLRWSPIGLPAATSASAQETPEEPGEFPPLPGQIRIAEHDLRASGGRAELYDVYAGLVSGRIVIAGAPGAGKSTSAIMLLLDALAHRGHLDDHAERAWVPVPVLLTAYRWDPVTCSVWEWLRDELSANYPLFGHSDGPEKAGALAAAPDKIALILEGLDELDPVPRRAALHALRDAPFRVVLLTRGDDTLQAISDTWPAGVLAVRVNRVGAAAAADYLRRAHPGPHPSGWSRLLAHLDEYPGGALARGLSTPLALTLLRDTYQAGDDVSELLDATRFRTPEAIERHLIARVLPASYASRPGRPPPRYTEAQARRTLSFLACKMGKDRDLMWWRIRRWASRTPRVLAAGLGGALLAGGLAGWHGGLPDGLVAGLVAGLALGLVLGIGNGTPYPAGAGRGRALGLGLLLGIVTVLGAIPVAWILSLVFGGFELDKVLINLFAPLVVTMSVYVRWPVGYERVVGAAPPMSPRQVWRNERVVIRASGVVWALAIGIVTVAAIAAKGAVGPGLLPWGWLIVLIMLLVLMPLLGLAGLMLGLLCSVIWPTTVAWYQLRLSRQVPAVGLMTFLEDARERGVLCTAGSAYQFRHAALHDHLIIEIRA